MYAYDITYGPWALEPGPSTPTTMNCAFGNNLPIQILNCNSFDYWLCIYIKKILQLMCNDIDNTY